MRLTKLIESMLDEATKKPSPGSQKAKEMGLVYRGYNRWEDPKNPGVTVAQVIDGQLVRVDPNEQEPGEAPARAANAGGTAAPAEEPALKAHNPVSGATTAPAPALEPEPDSYTGAKEEPEPEEPEIPQGDTAVDRLINAANGDYMKVKKVLAKKIRAGDGKAKDLFARVEEHEKAHQAEIQKAIADFEAKKQKELELRKAKYTSKYPSPQI